VARIVGIHGVDHQFAGENTVHSQWPPALKDGLSRVGWRLDSDDDLACAFYGDLFRPRGKGAINPPLDASDVNEGWESELL
jgi:hypothetical protein